MHELSIAEAVLAIACAHADGRRIARVELRVGHLRQVVPDALTFAFEMVARGTPAEGAQLAIEVVPAEGRCRACTTVAPLDALPLRCPVCGCLDLDLLRGEELLVDFLELDEPVTSTGGSGHGG